MKQTHTYHVRIHFPDFPEGSIRLKAFKKLSDAHLWAEKFCTAMLRKVTIKRITDKTKKNRKRVYYDLVGVYVPRNAAHAKYYTAKQWRLNGDPIYK